MEDEGQSNLPEFTGLLNNNIAVLRQKKIIFGSGEQKHEFEIPEKSHISVNVSTVLINSIPFTAETPSEALKWAQAIKGSLIETSIDIDDFKLLSVLGRGFYGKVTLAQSLTTQKLYAIKSVHKKYLIDSNAVETIIGERNALAQFNHPFIVKLHFAFQTPKKFYLGLEYLSGGEVFHRMNQEGSLSLKSVRLYAAEISLALDYMHKHGYVYRDLKPENVMLDGNGHATLTDFGLTKNINLDTTSSFCGTPEYVAPEIAEHKPYSYPVDWWALGILITEMLTQSTPFYARNQEKMFDSIIHKEPNLRQIKDPITKDLVSKLLTKDPNERPVFESIKVHPFFEEINWDKVYKKEYTPEYVPSNLDLLHPSNFDAEFTCELVKDSYAPDEPAFSGFSFPGQDKLGP